MVPAVAFAQEFLQENITVDQLTTQIDIALLWDFHRYKKDEFSFYLISPSGKIINAHTAVQSDAEVLDKDPFSVFRAYRIKGPEFGVWKAVVGHPFGATYTVSPMAYSGLKLKLDFLNHYTLLNEPLVLEATIIEPEPVKGVQITAQIKRYKKGSVTPDIFDLIFADHGMGYDKAFDDGIYTAVWVDTSVEGSYCAEIKAQGAAPRAGSFERSDGRCTVVYSPEGLDRVRNPHKYPWPRGYLEE